MKSITSTLHITSRLLHIAQHVLRSTMIITFAVTRWNASGRHHRRHRSFGMGTHATTEPPQAEASVTRSRVAIQRVRFTTVQGLGPSMTLSLILVAP